MRYTPVAVGLAVGFADGQIHAIPALDKYKHAHGLFKVAVAAVGLAGEVMGFGTTNVNYGMMTAAMELLGARVAPAVEGNSASLMLTDVVPAPAPQLRSAACTGCAGLHAAPLALPSPGIPVPAADYRPPA